MVALGGPDKGTLMVEAELLAVVVSIVLWKKTLSNHPLVAYIDNNSARNVCISEKARNNVGSSPDYLVLSVEDASGISPWFVKVPSPSNPADILSRELVETTASGRSTLVALPVQDIVSKILDNS